MARGSRPSAGLCCCSAATARSGGRGARAFEPEARPRRWQRRGSPGQTGARRAAAAVANRSRRRRRRPLSPPPPCTLQQPKGMRAAGPAATERSQSRRRLPPPPVSPLPSLPLPSPPPPASPHRHYCPTKVDPAAISITSDCHRRPPTPPSLADVAAVAPLASGCPHRSRALRISGRGRIWGSVR